MAAAARAGGNAQRRMRAQKRVQRPDTWTAAAQQAEAAAQMEALVGRRMMK